MRTERREATGAKVCPPFFLEPVSPEMPDRPAEISTQARFAARAGLFASLTLRAARNVVRYFATLRSYSGFVAMTRARELMRLSLSRKRSS